MLDPGCRLGHHVFADSANNGPVGRALVEELIPVIEEEYRGLGTADARFVTGHSSGGWSSLWLQVAYPDVFGGVWSLSPDPVDFRDFQRIDLTRPGVNLFSDDDGKPRPLARAGGKPLLYFKPFSDMETVMGHGGQLASFEAVFSPRGADGRPRPLWDRATGAVDPETARAWEKYDIRRKLEREWKTLGPKLAGKLHVYTGAEDTFYLEGAVRLLTGVAAGAWAATPSSRSSPAATTPACWTRRCGSVSPARWPMRSGAGGRSKPAVRSTQRVRDRPAAAVRRTAPRQSRRRVHGPGGGSRCACFRSDPASIVQRCDPPALPSRQKRSSASAERTDTRPFRTESSPPTWHPAAADSRRGIPARRRFSGRIVPASRTSPSRDNTLIGRSESRRPCASSSVRKTALASP